MNNSIILNSVKYDLQKSTQKLEENLPDWERDIFLFLVDWFSISERISVQTSGSTGTPKIISKDKSTLRNSAFMTGEFFQFSSGKTALLCLPAKYIAGKMMLVRAIEWTLDLDYIEPKTNMQIPEKNYFFSAMTPPQAEANLTKLSRFENLIIGGAAIKDALEKELPNHIRNCFATYGMTETVSHIALRKIGSSEYHTLPGISIFLNERKCLQISAPKLLKNPVVTNDLVDITAENCFIWQGRYDNVINSGGVKISPEIIEAKISHLIDSPFFVTGIPHEKWGEQAVLIIQGNAFEVEPLQSRIMLVLPKAQAPKQIIFLPKFNYTENGKLQRKETMRLI